MFSQAMSNVLHVWRNSCNVLDQVQRCAFDTWSQKCILKCFYLKYHCFLDSAPKKYISLYWTNPFFLFFFFFIHLFFLPITLPMGECYRCLSLINITRLNGHFNQCIAAIQNILNSWLIHFSGKYICVTLFNMPYPCHKSLNPTIIN